MRRPAGWPAPAAPQSQKQLNDSGHFKAVGEGARLANQRAGARLQRRGRAHRRWRPSRGHACLLFCPGPAGADECMLGAAAPAAPGAGRGFYKGFCITVAKRATPRTGHHRSMPMRDACRAMNLGLRKRTVAVRCTASVRLPLNLTDYRGEKSFDTAGTWTVLVFIAHQYGRVMRTPALCHVYIKCGLHTPAPTE